MSDIKTIANLDDLFTANLDDLADLASFETPPPGAYILRVSMEPKEINKKSAIEAAFEVVETVELTDDNDKPVVNGTKFSIAFFLDNEFGVGNMKKFLQPFAQHFGHGSIGQLIREDIKDLTISAVVKNRKDKNDPDRVHASVSNISVA
jgi:hypothetical protein